MPSSRPWRRSTSCTPAMTPAKSCAASKTAEFASVRPAARAVAPSTDGGHEDPYFDIPASAYGDEGPHGPDEVHIPHDVDAGVASGGPPPGQSQRKWEPKGDFKGKGGKGKWSGKGEWRKRDQDPTIGMPLELPPAPMNLAVRMLLLHGELWHQIGEQDLQLLHELPGEHGQLIAWLERFLVDNGPTPWAVLQVALQEADLMDLAQRVSGGPLTAPPGDEHLEAEFRETLRKLWIGKLQADADRIARSPQPDMARFQSLQRQIRDLKAV